jgi:hypothetical protein
MRKILLILIITTLISCSKQKLDDYDGYVVYEVSNFGVWEGPSFCLIKGDHEKRVYVYQLDYFKYRVGDTINTKSK